MTRPAPKTTREKITERMHHAAGDELPHQCVCCGAPAETLWCHQVDCRIMQNVMLSTHPREMVIDDMSPDWLAKAAGLANRFSQDPAQLLRHLFAVAEGRGINLYFHLPGQPAAVFAAPVPPPPPPPARPATVRPRPKPIKKPAPVPEPAMVIPPTAEDKPKENPPMPTLTENQKPCIEPGCGKIFEPAGKKSQRCDECQRARDVMLQREYNKKHRDKKRFAKEKRLAAIAAAEEKIRELGKLAIKNAKTTRAAPKELKNIAAEMQAKQLEAAAIDRQEAQARTAPAERTLVDLHMVIRDGNDGIAAAKMLANCVPTPFNNILSDQERPIVIHLVVKEEFGESYPPPSSFQ